MKVLRGIIVFCLLLLFTQPVHTETFTNPPKLVKQTDFGDGLFYEQYSHPLTGTFHLVRVKLSSMKWRVKPSINPACIMNAGSVKSLAQASNPNAVCGINASFFDPGNFPVGTVAIDGKIVSLDNRRRSTLGIKSNGTGIISVLTPKAFITPDDYFEPIWIWGYNHPTMGDSIIVYNHNWGSSQVAIPSDGKSLAIENGKVTRIVDKGVITIPPEGFVLIFRGKSKYHLERFTVGGNVTLGVTMPDEWEGVCDMVTGGPRLIDNGHSVDLKVQREGLASSFFKAHKRSVAGFTWNDELFFAMFPNPVTYESLASVLMETNVKDAIGLDGGSSSSIWVRGENSINGSKEVPVALVVVPREENDDSGGKVPFFRDIFKDHSPKSK